MNHSPAAGSDNTCLTQLSALTDDGTRLWKAVADPILQIRANALHAAVEAYTSTPISWPMIRRMAAALDAYEAAMIMPIAQVPRDGTAVLTFDASVETNWCEDYWDAEAPGGPDWNVCGEANPTHFRPVPSSAATEAALAAFEMATDV